MRSALLHGISVLTVNLFLLTTATPLVAQHKMGTENPDAGQLGLLVSLSTSCTGFGSQLSPQLSFSKRNFLVSAGPSIQLRSGHLSGMKLNFQYDLISSNEESPFYDSPLNLFTFLSSSYYFNANLGAAAERIERKVYPDKGMDYSNMSMSAIDLFAGMGLKWNISRKFMWMNSIGIGGYHIMESPTTLYHDATSIGITLRTGLCYKF